MRVTLLALAAALLALPTTATAQHHEDVKAEIEAVAAKWQAAYNAGDGAGVAALYTDDAMLMPPNAAPLSGRAAIEEFWTLAAGEGVTDELTTKEVHAMGDMAVEIGMYSATAADGSHADHGHYVAVFKQENGQWKLFRDIWNSDMAP